ncbi:beta-ketoacyl synthase N-terminal-like domain-containing protein [Streptomyces sp. NPDC048442]|uniref:beta-ketoacyl synthase N-terminal-like domain-containing protein n=1 Tax=Streptomyces sp. NPDC048442 TaxID=3154823 RepID=UPI003427DCBB
MKERQASVYERFQWFRYLQNPDDPGLTISYVYALTGDVDTDRLNDALREVVSTAFPRLLCYFTDIGGQLVARSRPAPRRVLHGCERPDDLLDSGGIDPTGQELFRFRYWREPEGRLLLRLDFSHVVFDGGCYTPFCAALSACWQGVAPVREKPFGPPRRPDADADAAHWRSMLAGRRLHQPLPFATAPSGRAGRRIKVAETITGAPAESLHRFLRHHELSLLQFVVGVTGCLVHAYGDDDPAVVVAHTVDTREYGAPYGCHTNLLPLWLDLSADPSALSVLEQVRTQREELRDHQGFGTSDLLALAAAEQGLAAGRGGSALNLVVNSSAAMLPTALPELAGVDTSWIRKPDTGSSSELSVNFSSDEQGIHLSFDSSTRVLSPEALSALATNFGRMAEFVIADPHRPLAQCDLSRPLEPAAEGAVRTATDHRSLGEALREAAAADPDRVAVVDDHRSLTYGELLGAAQRLGDALPTDDGAGADGGARPVGVFLERSAAIPVAYLTALSLRRTFVPLDPHLPDGRLTYMAETAALGVVLVDAATRDRAAVLFPGTPLQEVDGTPLREVGGAPAREVDGAPSTSVSPSPRPQDAPPVAPADAGRTAYVLFTSGSTGTPKGVAVSEGNLANFLDSVRQDPGMGPDDRLVALTPIGFDISLLEILLPLLCGGTVHVLPEEARTSATLLAERIDAGGASVVQATPSTWRILKSAGWRARRPMTLLCGGEALDRDLAQYLLSQSAAVYNMYGPTEATIWASWQRVTDADRIHLGEPALGTRYYVVDAEGRSVAPGMCGELMIAGDCVALGYLNAPATAFGALPDGTPSYRTGDLVRHDGPAHLTYVSRMDGQRKVNGHRIELGEVAAAVTAQAPDATVVAVVRAEPEPHLRCFVRLPATEPFDAAAVLARCRETLPYYMVPQAVHRLTAIPLTANGKTDVKKLSEAPLSALDLYPQDETPAPAAGVQQPPADTGGAHGPGLLAELRRLVAGELGLPEPDIDRPLGYQGVTSLGYNVLAARISDRYGVVVHAHDFYRMNTLRAVAETVAQLAGGRTGGPAKQHDARPEGAPRPPAAAPSAADGRLAIVGHSAVLPGGVDPDAFWQTLLDGRDCVGPAGAERRLPGEFAGFLPGVKGFDARFFSISPREASWMDPRQRLLLQSVWHTLEDAGYAASDLHGSRTGCYMAATGNDYALLQARADAGQIPYSLVGHSLSLVANRISSWFDWHGPSTVLDTACSGSLVALVKACRDLRAGVCDAAVVGGVNLILDSQINEGLHAARFLSPDHRCAAFDASANGYVRGEGYGSFLVKRLADALADGDDIRAVIESVAENHGGRANSLTAPNPNAQYRLLLDAYTPELAARTGYIETHGTGTVLGDAIEIDALKRAWQQLVPEPAGRRVRLGAVKSHIGHLEPAAGVASLTKVIKAFEHRTLPANLHFQQPNPGLALEDTPFEVVGKTVAWDDVEPVAGISSFGFGGSNAHVVLSAPPAPPARRATTARPRLVPLSARTPQALRRLTGRLLEHVERGGPLSDEDLRDLSYTLCRREHLEYRLAWCPSSGEELVRALRTAGEPVRAPARERAGDAPAPTPESAREAYLAGQPVDWQALFAPHTPHRLRLPGYPFDETDLWFTDEGRTA